MIMKTLNYNPMDKTTWGYDLLDNVNTLFVLGHPYSNLCYECWKTCKLPDKNECDDNGNPLYKQERYYKGENKSFYSEKYIDGKWKKGLSEVRRVLYKLPLVIEAIKNAFILTNPVLLSIS